jgi:DHA1 family bicyclomycin/chloramphenicol resistance-like MFS transporter
VSDGAAAGAATGAAATAAPPDGLAPTGAARPRFALIVVLGALSSFGPLSMDMYLPSLPSLTRDLNASASAGQLTLTSCMLGLALGQLVAGPVSDRRGRRRPLLVGLTGFMVASVVCAFMPSIWPLIGVRFIQGVAGGSGIVIARAVVRDLFAGATAARLFSTLMMITGIAPVVAPLIGAQVLRVSSWRGVFVVLGAVGLPLLLMAVFGLRETLPGNERHGGGLRETLKTFRRLMADRRFAPFALAFSLSFSAMFAYIAGSSFVLENVFHTSPQVFSVVFAVNSVGFVAVTQAGARAVGRFGPATLLRWGVVLVAAGSVAVLGVTAGGAGLWPLLIALMVMMAGNGLAMPNGIAAAMTGQASALGAASALLGLGQFGLGALLGPLVGIAGPDNALPMGIIMAACGVAALGVVRWWAPR